jgi:membrane-bound ClpP family serine protease
MIILSFLGLLLFLIGWIWLIIVGFKQGGALWGILIFFFSWLAGLVFAIMNKTGWTQLILMIVGFVLMMVGGMAAGFSSMDTMPATR